MHMAFSRIAKWMAYLGGLALIAILLITCLSVVGRSLNTIGHSPWVKNNFTFLSESLVLFGPINGDFEIVEAGVAFAIMAFLPWCQIVRGHAVVELFTSFLPLRANKYLALFWEVIFAAVLFLIAWRLFVGMSDKMRYGETTFLLQFPIWWGYAACGFAAAIACVTAVYSVWLHGLEAVSARRSITSEGDQQT